MNTRPSLILLLFLAALTLFHNAWYAPQLPPVVASHFDGAGMPNGWMTRQVFSLLYAGLVVLMAGIFLLTGKLLERVPDKLVSLPNKDYWLEPSRREGTYVYIRTWGYRFGSAAVAFIAAVMHLVVRVNLGQDRALHGVFPWLIGVFVLVSGATSLSLVMHFRRVPPEPGRDQR